VGETIEYTVYVTVPPWTDGFRPATVTDITVQFQSPDLVVCILDTSLTLTPGSTETYLPADYPCLNYVVRAQDVQPITMGVVAYGNASGTSWVSDVGDPAYDERQITTTVIQPNTEVSISASADTICEGDSVVVTFCEENTGDDPLTDVYVELSPYGTTFDETSPEFTGTDTGSDGVLSPAEVWCWEVTDAPAADITYDVTGHGTDSFGNDVTIPAYPDEYAEVPVVVEPCAVYCRITGGGTIDDSTVRHGFELYCNAPTLPNNLEVNWGKNNKFHLTELTEAYCSDDPSIEPTPPACDCDTYYGFGIGRYNGVDGYRAEWIFTDAGEPGRNDWAWIKITDGGGNTVLEQSGFLRFGNQQFHRVTGSKS